MVGNNVRIKELMGFFVMEEPMGFKMCGRGYTRHEVERGEE